MATWNTGHYFANPSNRFWTLLHRAGLCGHPESNQDDHLVQTRGFGFCDVMEAPGSDAQQVSRNLMRQNIPVFMKRIEKYAISMNGTLRRVCFIGKRQWKHLFDHQLPRCNHGIQPTDLRPEQWPEILDGVEVWVMPSPSGRAVISKEERQATYNDLSSAING